jgi:Flp pilus assembly protein TadD
LAGDVALLTDLGDQLAQRGDTPGAERAYRRAVAIDPDDAEVRRRLSVLLLRRGAREEARIQIASALRIQPNRTALLDLEREAVDAAPEPR